jgi:hypothetical protein
MPPNLQKGMQVSGFISAHIFHVLDIGAEAAWGILDSSRSPGRLSLQAIEEAGVTRIREFKPQEISNVLWAFGVLSSHGRCAHEQEDCFSSSPLRLLLSGALDPKP